MSAGEEELLVPDEPASGDKGEGTSRELSVWTQWTPKRRVLASRIAVAGCLAATVAWWSASRGAARTSALRTEAEFSGFSEAAGAKLIQHIYWKADPSKCLDVRGNDAGATLQVWNCADLVGAEIEEDDPRKDLMLKWVVPAPMRGGNIKWAANEMLCLDAPNPTYNALVQLWYCASAPVKHTRWTIDMDGRIHLSSMPEKCLDIPGPFHARRDGLKLQLKKCDLDESAKQLFDVYKRDCKWQAWSSWSECSRTCGGGSRYRMRHFSHEAKNGGKSCSGTAKHTHDGCNAEECTTTSTTTTTKTTTFTTGAPVFFR